MYVPSKRLAVDCLRDAARKRLYSDGAADFNRKQFGSLLAAGCWLLAAPLDRTWPLTSEDEKSHKLVA